VSGSGQDARRSLERLLASHTPFECRTTIHPSLLSQQAIGQIGRQLAAMGVKHYALQHFRTLGCADLDLTRRLKTELAGEDYLPPELVNELEGLFPQFEVRNA